MNYSSTLNISDCLNFCIDKYYNLRVQKQLDRPMPWIGMYIAAASAVCSLAMAADGLSGFRGKKLWFPCKFFCLNAFSLTLLAVVAKLPVDLTSDTRGYDDRYARITSLVLISTAMANFMPSLGSMEDNEIMVNLVALGILIGTIAGNVFIYDFQMRSMYNLTFTLGRETASVGLMVLMLLDLCCLGVMVPNAKRYVESKYNEVRKRVSVEGGRVGVDELGVVVKRYWVMAVSSSPQFVMARSAISATSGLLCVAGVAIMVEAYVPVPFMGNYGMPKVIQSSSYAWSINWIMYVQSVGAVLNVVAPLCRWYVAASFKLEARKSLKEEVKIENYWTSRLVEWRESSLPVQIRHYRCRKLLHDAKRLVVNVCIGLQFLFVLTSKLLLHCSALCGGALLLLRKKSDSSAERGGFDLRPYVLLLEGETQLPEKILRYMCNEVENMIQIGERKQPKNLIKLLYKSTVNFNGVGEFDSDEVPRLHLQEPPNCWSLPVVTLTGIAVALPNVTNGKAQQLLSGVREGLSLVNLIEKTHDENGETESIRDAADVAWVEVELYRKWQENDLQNIGRTHKETLQILSSLAEKAINDFIAETKDDTLLQNPIHWPAKAVAANSMYRVAQTLLLAHKDDETNEDIFDRLSIIISDILAACLTNLAHAITLKCQKSGIKERQDSVSQAATLVGQSRQIFDFLEQHRDLPCMEAGDAANIDKWRACLGRDNQNLRPSISKSSNDTTRQVYVPKDLEA